MTQKGAVSERPNEAEVLATTLPGPGWPGWYCDHGAESIANSPERAACWACGAPPQPEPSFHGGFVE